MKINSARLLFGFIGSIIVLLLELIPILIVYFTESYSLLLYIGVPLTLLGGLIVGILSFKKDIIEISAIICSLLAVILVIVFYRALLIVVSEFVAEIVTILLGLVVFFAYILVLLVVLVIAFVALLIGAFGGKLISNRIWDDKKKEEIYENLKQKLKKAENTKKTVNVPSTDSQ